MYDNKTVTTASVSNQSISINSDQGIRSSKFINESGERV